MITQNHIDAYAADGVVLVRGLLRDWVDIIAQGIDQNMAEPGPYAAENTTATDTGRFFDDYCNWPRIPAFEKIIRDSPAGQSAAQIMQSRTAQFFHDHVLVKEPGTSKKTPWHQDSPYYFVEGRQTVSIWVPVDPVGLDACPQFIKGSHLWDKLLLPVRRLWPQLGVGWMTVAFIQTRTIIYPFQIRMQSPTAIPCCRGPCSRATPSCLITAPSMVRLPIRVPIDAEHFPCAGLEMMPDMWSVQGVPLRPIRGIACRRASAFGTIGFPCFGPVHRLVQRDTKQTLSLCRMEQHQQKARRCLSDHLYGNAAPGWAASVQYACV